MKNRQRLGGQKKATKDFAKKKHKLGKGKRIPDNATRTSFKSRSIQLPSQLCNDAKGPVTYRKLSLQELCKQLGHPKQSVRKDALMGLRELFISNPHLLITCIGDLIKKVSPLFADQYDSVRHSLYLLLKLVFQVIDQKVISPFFSLLLASTKCGLTHINTSIQTNSVKITDLLIERYPSLIKISINSLLPLYLPLVAMKTQSSSSKTKKLDVHSLYVAKQPVLSQLLNFMLLVSDDTIATPCHAPIISVQDGKVWPEGDPLSPPRDITEFYLQSPFLLKINPSLFQTNYCFNSEMSSTTALELESIRKTGFENQFIKVLLELWIELVSESLIVTPPSGSTQNDIYSLLATIIQLLCILVKHFATITKNIFCNQFINHFIPYYPIHHSQQQRLTPDIFMLNIHFSKLIILMAKAVPSINLFDVNHFLISRLPQATSILSSNDLVQCVAIMIDIINITRNTTQSDKLIPLYCSYYKLFVNCHPVSTAKTSFLKYVNVATRQLMTSTIKSNELFCGHFLYPCLSSLPLLLTQLTNAVDQVQLVIQVLKYAMACQIDGVLNQFQKHISKLYSSQGVLPLLPRPLQQSLIQLISHVHNFTSSDLSLFALVINSGLLDVSIAMSLITSIHFKHVSLIEDSRVSGIESTPTLIANHISFLFSTLLGHSMVDLAKLEETSISFPNNTFTTLTTPSNSCYTFTDRIKRSKIIVDFLASSNIPIGKFLEIMIHRVLTLYHTLPYDAAIGILLTSLNLYNDQRDQLSTNRLTSSLPPLLVSVLVAMETNVTSNHSYVDYMYQLVIQIMAMDIKTFLNVCNLLILVEPCTAVANVFIRLIDEIKWERNTITMETLSTLAQQIVSKLHNTITIDNNQHLIQQITTVPTVELK